MESNLIENKIARTASGAGEVVRMDVALPIVQYMVDSGRILDIWRVRRICKAFKEVADDVLNRKTGVSGLKWCDADKCTPANSCLYRDPDLTRWIVYKELRVVSGTTLPTMYDCAAKAAQTGDSRMIDLVIALDKEDNPVMIERSILMGLCDASIAEGHIGDNDRLCDMFSAHLNAIAVSRYVCVYSILDFLVGHVVKNRLSVPLHWLFDYMALDVHANTEMLWRIRNEIASGVAEWMVLSTNAPQQDGGQSLYNYITKCLEQRQPEAVKSAASHVFEKSLKFAAETCNMEYINRAIRDEPQRVYPGMLLDKLGEYGHMKEFEGMARTYMQSHATEVLDNVCRLPPIYEDLTISLIEDVMKTDSITEAQIITSIGNGENSFATEWLIKLFKSRHSNDEEARDLLKYSFMDACRAGNIDTVIDLIEQFNYDPMLAILHATTHEDYCATDTVQAILAKYYTDPAKRNRAIASALTSTAAYANSATIDVLMSEATELWPVLSFAVAMNEMVSFMTCTTPATALSIMKTVARLDPKNTAAKYVNLGFLAEYAREAAPMQKVPENSKNGEE